MTTFLFLVRLFIESFTETAFCHELKNQMFAINNYVLLSRLPGDLRILIGINACNFEELFQIFD